MKLPDKSRFADLFFSKSVIDPMYPSILPGWERHQAKLTSLIRRKLSKCPIFAIDSVDLYAYENKKTEWRADSFPCVAPPFSEFFVESFMMDGVPDTVPWGIFFDVFDLTDPANTATTIDALGNVFNMGPLAVKNLTVLFNHPEARWALCCRLFASIDGEIVGPLVSVLAIVDVTGKFFQNALAHLKVLHFPANHPIYANEQDERHLLAHFRTAWLALSFMHCKNVQIIDNKPTPVTGVHKYFRRNKGVSTRLVYKTLEINPMKEILRKEGQSESVGLIKALHICRGHFKEYKGAGLFGKHKGLYWWDNHVRGSADAGVILKDYKVTT